MQLDMILYTASTWVLPVLIAITLHEATHGWFLGARGMASSRLARGSPFLTWINMFTLLTCHPYL